jgi:hypothetical protein
MYKLLITITNPKAEGPITISVFGHVVHFEYISRGRVRKLTGILESPASISKDGIDKVKALLKEHGTGVEVTYKEDPVIAKAAKNIEKMLSGLGEKMNKKSMRAKSSVSQKAMTRKKVAKAMRSIAAMPETEMSAAMIELPRSVQQAVMAQSSKRGRTFSSRSMRNRGSMSKTMRRAREKKYAHMMKKRLAMLATIAEGNERNRS